MKLSHLAHGTWLLTASALTGCVANVDTQGAPLSQESSEVVCESAAPVAPFKELMIVDSSVVTSPAASNASGESGGALSFHHAMARLAGPGANVAAFTEAFLHSWEVEHKVGPGTVKAVPNGGIQALLHSSSFWPRLPTGELDMKRAPFRLLAVANRLDLASASKPNGEARLVFGVVSPSGGGIPMTVIFEYSLPCIGGPDRKAWAERWHALAALDFGPAFNDALSTLVEGYTARENLSQLRTSDVFLSNEWVLREFHLDLAAGALVTATTAQAPDFTLNNSSVLVDWVNANAEAILSNTHVVPAELLGGQAFMAFPALMNFNFSGTQWLMGNNGQPLVDAELRHAFASQTCNGCHQSDMPEGGQPVDIFYQVSPTRSVSTGDGTDRLSPFIRTIELPRRALFLADQLPCAQ
jgi:hypothetical protein